MRAHPSRGSRLWTQAGFSMIEMLMTAFILAVGILGLSMLQLMSLKASRGGRSMSTAVLVGEHVMDQVEMEGRLGWLNATGNYKNPNMAVDLPNLRYLNLPDGGTRVQTFNSKGGPPLGNPDPADNTTYFTVTTTRADFVVNPANNGALSNVTVQVQFTDQLDQANLPVLRTVTLTRRILHG